MNGMNPTGCKLAPPVEMFRGGYTKETLFELDFDEESFDDDKLATLDGHNVL